MAEILTVETGIAKRSYGVVGGALELKKSRGLRAGLRPNLILRALHVYLSIDKFTRA
jgi:hypothetical protein